MYDTNAFMKIALSEAIKASAKQEVPVGAVIVHEGEVIAKCHNSTRCNLDPTAHAEILCIREAAQKLGAYCLDTCDMYVTLEPCAMCAQAMAFSRIKRLYFGAYDEKFGAIENGARLFNAKSANHIPEIYGGINQTECTKILQDFFKEKRRKSYNV